MKHVRPFFMVIFTLSIMFSTNCSTKMYKGPSRSAEKRAIIETQATMISLGYWIWPAIGTIDGERTSKLKIYDSMRRFQRFEVLPGEHVLSVTVVTSHLGERGTYTIMPINLKFNARGGHVYCVKIVRKADGHWGKPIVVDKTSNQPVQ